MRPTSTCWPQLPAKGSVSWRGYSGTSVIAIWRDLGNRGRWPVRVLVPIGPEPYCGRAARRCDMPSGTVKWFNPTKGYEFIQPSGGGGKDVFVHISAVERAGLSSLNEGQTVEYEIESNRGKNPRSISRSGDYFAKGNRSSLAKLHGGSRCLQPRTGARRGLFRLGERAQSVGHYSRPRSHRESSYGMRRGASSRRILLPTLPLKPNSVRPWPLRHRSPRTLAAMLRSERSTFSRANGSLQLARRVRG